MMMVTKITMARKRVMVSNNYEDNHDNHDNRNKDGNLDNNGN
jgi:hypothetical protein